MEGQKHEAIEGRQTHWRCSRGEVWESIRHKCEKRARVASSTCGIKCIAGSTLTFPPTQRSISFFYFALSLSLSPSPTSLLTPPLITLSPANHPMLISVQVPACVSRTKTSCLFVFCNEVERKVKYIDYVPPTQKKKKKSQCSLGDGWVGDWVGGALVSQGLGFLHQLPNQDTWCILAMRWCVCVCVCVGGGGGYFFLSFKR